MGKHENDPDYGWGPANTDPKDFRVPSDLVRYYLQFKKGYWAYVCPCCKIAFPPGAAGMPAGFRAHLRTYLEGNGCMFNPRAKSSTSQRHDREVAGF